MRTLGFGLSAAAAVVALGCGGDGSGDGTGGTSGASSGGASSGGASSGGTSSGGTSSGGTSSGGTSSGGSGGTGGTPSASCAPLPPPSGATVELSQGMDLTAALNSAAPGTTLLLADGNYDVSNSALYITKAGISIRGKSGDRSKVILDSKHKDNGTGGIISVRATDVTIAHLTLKEARYHAIHVSGGDSADVTGTRIHDVHVIDPGEQGIKINANGGHYTDDGVISCSRIELTRPGAAFVQSNVSSGSTCYTGGVDGHDARGWVVRDNHIEGFWCEGSDLSEHGIHFWTGSRDTVVVRNVLVNNARHIGFGLVGSGRSYSDNPCPGQSKVGHYGGLIANNFMVATEAKLFASPNGHDSGISLWYACDAKVLHNSYASTSAPASSAIEYRFASTSALIANNLSTHAFKARDGAKATSETNAENAAAGDFVNVAGSDLHLTAGASVALDKGTNHSATVADDIDGDARSTTPDLGADER
ncbi:MAG: hypothetical protein R3B13_00210 [Polyangiaceae bacterium]